MSVRAPLRYHSRTARATADLVVVLARIRSIQTSLATLDYLESFEAVFAAWRFRFDESLCGSCLMAVVCLVLFFRL